MFEHKISSEGIKLKHDQLSVRQIFHQVQQKDMLQIVVHHNFQLHGPLSNIILTDCNRPPRNSYTTKYASFLASMTQHPAD